MIRPEVQSTGLAFRSCLVREWVLGMQFSAFLDASGAYQQPISSPSVLDCRPKGRALLWRCHGATSVADAE